MQETGLEPVHREERAREGFPHMSVNRELRDRGKLKMQEFIPKTFCMEVREAFFAQQEAHGSVPRQRPLSAGEPGGRGGWRLNLQDTEDGQANGRMLHGRPQARIGQQWVNTHVAGILPLSGLSLEAVSVDPKAPHSPHMFEISGPTVDSKVFICASAAELQRWMQHIEDRKYKSMAQPMSPSHCALSYLLPCDEHWKREELKKYLLQAPIWQWEGSPIQHMGQPGYISIVHIINTQRRGLQERLMVLFPQDVLLLSVDNKRLNIRYEGRLPRHSIKAVERFALPGRLEFELTGELVEPLQVSCTCEEDYRNWMFQLQQPDRNRPVPVSRSAPPLMPKLQRSRKESQEAVTPAGQRHITGRS
ncbi:rho guanine nucleotide exchange factor 7-like [Pseudoliparis swirei]|uniref:rho guanine nucleotide exchange factor 7-like n=1 Tax=Pseudoliparis swirei TaxID=2059687 RepID=UPI0024BE3411|nr:rho guanine nucleotide exchange factor 7-like [Pseudoliparis swirei]